MQHIAASVENTGFHLSFTTPASSQRRQATFAPPMGMRQANDPGGTTIALIISTTAKTPQCNTNAGLIATYTNVGGAHFIIYTTPCAVQQRHSWASFHNYRLSFMPPQGHNSIITGPPSRRTLFSEALPEGRKRGVSPRGPHRQCWRGFQWHTHVPAPTEIFNVCPQCPELVEHSEVPIYSKPTESKPYTYRRGRD